MSEGHKSRDEWEVWPKKEDVTDAAYLRIMNSDITHGSKLNHRRRASRREKSKRWEPGE